MPFRPDAWARILGFVRSAYGVFRASGVGQTASGEGPLDLPKHLEKGESGHGFDAISADSLAQTRNALADEST